MEPRSISIKPTFIDLCCGAGGFSYGFKKAGWLPLLGVDACTKSLQSYALNVCKSTLTWDLLKRNSAKHIALKLKNVRLDAVIAGAPCQGFSRAGRRDPKDPRNRVFVACARIAVGLNPKLIVFENVPYLAKKPFSRFLQIAKSILKKGGYEVRQFEVQAGKFRIPQRRMRLFLVGFKRISHTCLDEAIECILRQDEPAITVREAWNGLPSDCASSSTQFHNHEPMLHSSRVKQKISRIKPGTGPLSYRKLHPELPALTLIAGHSAMPCHYAVDRTITVREAARIQSFDDDFIFAGGKRSEMNQVANAVPPRLAQHLANNLKPIIITCTKQLC